MKIQSAPTFLFVMDRRTMTSRGGKGHRFSKDTGAICFRNPGFRERDVGGATVEPLGNDNDCGNVMVMVMVMKMRIVVLLMVMIMVG